MTAACQTIYKDTYHIHCIWHMFQNLPKRLKHKLGATDFKTFNTDFWKMHNSLCVEVFEQRFQALIEKFPNSSTYMCNTLIQFVSHGFVLLQVVRLRPVCNLHNALNLLTRLFIRLFLPVRLWLRWLNF